MSLFISSPTLENMSYYFNSLDEISIIFISKFCIHKSQICSNALGKFPDHLHLIFMSFGRLIQCLFVLWHGVINKVEQVLSDSKCQRLT